MNNYLFWEYQYWNSFATRKSKTLCLH